MNLLLNYVNFPVLKYILAPLAYVQNDIFWFKDNEEWENRNYLHNVIDFTSFCNHVFHISHTTWKQEIKWPNFMV